MNTVDSSKRGDGNNTSALGVELIFCKYLQIFLHITFERNVAVSQSPLGFGMQGTFLLFSATLLIYIVFPFR